VESVKKSLKDILQIVRKYIPCIQNLTGPSGRAIWRRRFVAARLLRLWVRIPSWAWMSVCLFHVFRI